MTPLRISLAVLLLTAGTFAWTQGQPQRQRQEGPSWRRATLPSTGLSLEVPSDLKQESVQEVKDEADWVRRVVDFTFLDTDIFASITWFEGREPGKINRSFLSAVQADFLKGVEDKESKARVLLNETKDVAGLPAIRTRYRVDGGANDKFFLDTLFLAADGRVFSIVLVYFDEAGGVGERARRIIQSVRYTKPPRASG